MARVANSHGAARPLQAKRDSIIAYSQLFLLPSIAWSNSRPLFLQLSYSTHCSIARERKTKLFIRRHFFLIRIHCWCSIKSFNFPFGRFSSWDGNKQYPCERFLGDFHSFNLSKTLLKALSSEKVVLGHCRAWHKCHSNLAALSRSEIVNERWTKTCNIRHDVRLQLCWLLSSQPVAANRVKGKKQFKTLISEH